MNRFAFSASTLIPATTSACAQGNFRQSTSSRAAKAIGVSQNNHQNIHNAQFGCSTNSDRVGNHSLIIPAGPACRLCSTT